MSRHGRRRKRGAPSPSARSADRKRAKAVLHSMRDTETAEAADSLLLRLHPILLELCGRLDAELSSEKDFLAIETALGKAALQGAQTGRDEIAAHMRAKGIPIHLPSEVATEHDEWAERYGS